MKKLNLNDQKVYEDLIKREAEFWDKMHSSTRSERKYMFDFPD